MLRIGKGILFSISCIIVFFLFLGIGTKLATAKITNDKLGDIRIKWGTGVGTVLQDISYGEKDANKYDLYLPAGKTGNCSLFLHIHGGGFNSGDKSEGEILCKYLASKGYVAVSVNYSLMDDTHTSNLNVMYDELVDALGHVLQRSKEEGYAITEMAATGESAGGALAMLLAFRYGEQSPVPIRFVIQESGPASFEPSLWAPTTPEGQVDFINSMTGKKFTVEDYDSDEYRQAINEISPVSYINAETIPMLCAYGVNDKIVPPTIKFPMLDALERYTIPHDYIEFPNSGHGLLNDPEKLKDYHKKMIQYADAYFDGNV